VLLLAVGVTTATVVMVENQVMAQEKDFGGSKMCTKLQLGEDNKVAGSTNQPTCER